MKVIKKIAESIKNTKFENNVFLAGGAVRDEIMGNIPKDYDFCVSLPNGGIRFAMYITRYFNENLPIVFDKFGTANFRIMNHEFESVMARSEKYDTNTRKPVVSYSSLEDDAYRRDLTINSLFKNIINGEILDLTGKGINDIKDKIIRTPTDPNTTFFDDPLRMLRCIRFCVKYNFHLPYYIIKSIKLNSYRLKVISKERIRTEIDKMLLSDFPYRSLKLIELTKLNDYIFPELKLKSKKIIKHSTNNLILRLSILFQNNKDVEIENILRKLTYPNIIIKKVKLVVNSFNFISVKNKNDLRLLRSEIDGEMNSFLELLELNNINIKKLKDMLNQMQDEPPKPKLPIDGNDIMKTLKIKPGPMIGKLLDVVKTAWYDNPEISKEKAMELVKNAYKNVGE